MTPLEAWLKDRGMTIAEAKERCRKYEMTHPQRRGRCLGGLSTLMQHPFTMPNMAYDVACALRIPAKVAAPMGKPLDPERWKNIQELSKPDPIDLDTEWWKRLGKAANDDEPDGVYLNVMAFRRILSERGVDWYEFEHQHETLYKACRSFAVRAGTRKEHIKELADIMGVDVHELLTDISRIQDQQMAFGTSGTQINRTGMPKSGTYKECGRADPDKIRAVMRRNGITSMEAGKRYAEITHAMERTDMGYSNSWTQRLRDMPRADFNSWTTISTIAKAIQCEPEEIAMRLSAQELADIRRKQSS